MHPSGEHRGSSGIRGRKKEWAELFEGVGNLWTSECGRAGGMKVILLQELERYESRGGAR